MDWTDEEKKALVETWANSPPEQSTEADVLEVATKAAELLAARGGTMTAEELHDAEQRSEHGCDPRLFEHISAQGARVAVLEKERDEARRSADELQRQRDNYRESLEVMSAGRDAALAELETLRRNLADAQKGAREAALKEADTKILSTALPPAYFEEDYTDRKEREAMHQGFAAGVNHALDTLRAMAKESGPQRYPCSPTCTHDDAATPGHPERVENLSKALASSLGYEPERVTERSEAVSIAAGRPELSATEAACYEQGAEAMRAACWEAVQREIMVYGFNGSHPAYKSIKAAIEGVTP